MNYRRVLQIFVVVCGVTFNEGIRAAEPKKTPLAIHVAPVGDDKNPGTSTRPLRTLHSCLEKLVRLKKSGVKEDVSVVIHPGFFALRDTLTIGSEHVPVGRQLRFVGQKDRKRPVISGGRQIGGWRRTASGILTARIADVASGKWTFRELFVNGERRPRARHPNSGYFRIVKASADRRTGFYFKPGDLPSNVNAGGELVFLHDWSISRVRVKSLDFKQQLLTVANSIGCKADHYRIDHFEKHPRYYLENDRALLDQPGEWYLNEKTGVLSYKPHAGETPKSITAIAPYVGDLVIVRGTEKQPVKNVHFQNLTFAHSSWRLPQDGYASGQATVNEWRDSSARHSARKMMESAITFEMATDCSVTGCVIKQIGRSGIAFGSRTHRCRLEKNLLEDISGNSINLGEDTSRRVKGRVWWQAASEQAASHHDVANNVIRHGGQQFFGSVAIWVGIAHHMHIHHNDINHHPYTGVSLGWMWNPQPTPAGQHLVEKNHIHHIMQVLSDGGGIYTLGRQPGTKLSANYIHDVPLNAGRAESNGMFLDQGSDQIAIVGNVIHKLERSPLRFHQAKDIAVERNTLVTPNSTVPAYRYNRTSPETIDRDGNSVLQESKFDPRSARPIIEAAGVKKALRQD